MKKIFLFSVIFLFGCSPKIVIDTVNTDKTYPEVQPYESFAMIEKNVFAEITIVRGRIKQI